MPRFVLPVLTGISLDADLASNAVNAPVVVSLRDALLNSAVPVTLAATVQARSGNRHTVTLQAAFNPPAAIWGGLFELNSLTLTLRYAGASPTLEADGITTDGILTWSNARSLGFATALQFRVTYNSAAARFSFTLVNPVPLPGGFAQLNTGLLSTEIPVGRPAIIVTVAGQAQLTGSGSASAQQLLQQVFGASVPINTISGFVIRQEFSLSAGGAPSPVRFPDFDFTLPPIGNLPSLPGLPAGLDLSLGVPLVRLPLTIPLPSTWTLRFVNCHVSFPIEALTGVNPLAGVDLLGNLEWGSDSAGQKRLAFEPTLPGSIELPDILRFLFGSLKWMGAQLPLHSLANVANLTLEELDWQGLFNGLLPTPLPAALDLNGLRVALRDLVNAALATTQLGRERIFSLAFSGLQHGGQSALTVAWDVWFQIADHSGLPDLFRFMLAQPSALLDGVLIALAKCAGLRPDQLVTALFSSALTIFSASFSDFIALLIRLLATLIRELNDDEVRLLARSVRDALTVFSMQPRPATFRLASQYGFGFHALFPFPDRTPVQFVYLGTVLGLSAASPSFVQAAVTAPFGTGALSRSWSTIIAPFVPLVERFVIEAKRLVDFFKELFQPNPGDTPANRRRQEEILMMIVTFPLIGQIFTVIVIAVLSIPNALLYARYLGDLMSKAINTDSGRKVKTFESGKKYVIFSDLHRDSQSDDLGPLKPGSIDHFSANAQLYLQLLTWAQSQPEYIVLEAGDCEELWYITSAAVHETPNVLGETGFPKKLREIIVTHQAIYDKLRELHHEGRYFRIYGNHDSYLRDADVFSILKTEMEKPVGGQPGKPFEIFEYFIIRDVKKMLEHTIVDAFLNEIWPQDKSKQQKSDLIRRVLEGRLGMDSNDYTDMCPLLVTHGHQFDFWNNDATNLLGKLISNAVGVQADWLLDPVLDLRGIAIGGSPALDFVDIAAAVPVWSNWPGEQAALKFAHRVQHTPNSDRKLVDDIFYNESFAAVFGTLFMAINGKDAAGGEVTPTTSGINMDSYAEFKQFFERHHNHHICVGHTHNPQCQPYFTSTHLPILGNMVDFFINLIHSLKSRYINSGTVGWMEGVVWGINIGADKQARLVYWTPRSNAPEPMDWELSPFDPVVKAALNRSIDDVLDDFRQCLEEIGAVRVDLRDQLAKQFSLPFDTYAAMLMRGGVSDAATLSALSEARPGAAVSEDWSASMEKIQLKLVSFLLQFRSRILTRSTAPSQSFTLEVPLTVNVRDTLQQLTRWYDTATSPAASALAAAALAHSLLEGFPRNLPTMSRTMRLLGVLPEVQSATPVLRSLCSLLPLLPVFGAPLEAANQRLSGRVEVTPLPALRVTLTMEHF